MRKENSLHRNYSRNDSTGLISVKIQPRSSKNQVVDFSKENVFKIKLSSPPVDGKANKDLKKFLSSILKVPKSNIEIKVGEKSREKLLSIKGKTSDQIKDILKKEIVSHQPNKKQ